MQADQSNIFDDKDFIDLGCVQVPQVQDALK